MPGTLVPGTDLVSNCVAPSWDIIRMNVRSVLGGMSSPLGRIVMFSCVVAFHQSIQAYGGTLVEESIGTPIWNLGMALLLVAWVYEDHRQSRYWPCFEYDVFLFFAWPLVLPHYLVRTRGIRGLMIYTGFLALYIFPAVCAAIIYVVTHGAGAD